VIPGIDKIAAEANAVNFVKWDIATGQVLATGLASILQLEIQKTPGTDIRIVDESCEDWMVTIVDGEPVIDCACERPTYDIDRLERGETLE